MEVAVDLQEGFLINVARVLGTLHQVQRQPQHVAVVAAHQFLEGSAATRLRLGHETPLVELGQRSHRGQSGSGIRQSGQDTFAKANRGSGMFRFLFAPRMLWL